MIKILTSVCLLALLSGCGGGGESENEPIIDVPINEAPISSAGPNQNVFTGSLVTLDGSASTDDGGTLTYSWSLLSGPTGSAAMLSSSSNVSPTFTADVDGVYLVELVVDDGTLTGSSETVTIVAQTANSAPMSDAGALQNVVTGTTVVLDGSGSNDANGDPITYEWSFSSLPPGSTTTLSNAEIVNPSFVVDIDGTYVVSLTTNDGLLTSEPNEVTVVAVTNNAAPVANAGDDQTVFIGDSILLDGSMSSDADQDGLTYVWSFVSSPSASESTFDDNTAFNPSFLADSEGEFVLSLRVNDGSVQSATDSVVISVIKPRVQLFRRQGGITPIFNDVPFPYDARTLVNSTRTGFPPPETIILDTFKIESQGQDFTVVNSVVNIEASLTFAGLPPYFEGLPENMVLNDGEAVEFNLVSPLTRGETLLLDFTFEIEETGEVFKQSYTLLTN